MKNKFLSAVSVMAFMLVASCSSDDSSAVFNDANGNVAKKYIKDIQVVSAQDASENRTMTVTYDANGRVTNASNGTETSTFAYEGGNLAHVTGTNDVLVINDMFQTPYDGYEYGDVLAYDNNGNPVEVRIYKRDWTGEIMEEYKGEITYDAKPNPFFYTLEAAGIIDVLDNVELNFSMTPQAPELIKAKLLLPSNNPKKVVIKHLNGTVKKQVVADYVYDAANYPSTATFTETIDGEVRIYTAAYTYKQ